MPLIAILLRSEAIGHHVQCPVAKLGQPMEIGSEVSQMADQLTPALIDAQLAIAQGLFHRLMFVAGRNSTDVTRVLTEAAARDGFPVLNIGEQLAKVLMQIPNRHRATRVAKEFNLLVGQSASHTVAVNHIEVLFATELRLNVLPLLRTVSRHTTLLVAWPGDVLYPDLVYAPSDHPEHQHAALDDVLWSQC